jgi:hypothetical protein
MKPASAHALAWGRLSSLAWFDHQARWFSAEDGNAWPISLSMSEKLKVHSSMFFLDGQQVFSEGVVLVAHALSPCRV